MGSQVHVKLVDPNLRRELYDDKSEVSVNNHYNPNIIEVTGFYDASYCYSIMVFSVCQVTIVILIMLAFYPIPKEQVFSNAVGFSHEKKPFFSMSNLYDLKLRSCGYSPGCIFSTTA